MKLKFDTHGNEKQKEAARLWTNDTTTDIVYGGSKGSGKSYLGCSMIFGDAFIYPGIHCFIPREELNDLRKFTVPSIYEVFGHWGLTEKYYKYNGQDNMFTLYNDSVVYLLEAKKAPRDPLYQRFGSMQMTRGWIEEAGQIDEGAKNNLMASIGRKKNDEYKLAPKLLQTCNPSKNYLYREYYKKHKDGNIEDWKAFVQALPHDNKKLPSGYIENLLRTLSPNEIERLIYGNWEYDDDPARLIEYDDILNMFTNDFVPEGKKYITFDVARFGRDKTVIGVWSGFRCIHIVTMKQNTIPQAAEKVNELRREYGVPLSQIIGDEGGVGGGAIDMIGCKGFISQSKPINKGIKNDQFNHLKSQCYFKFADRVSKHGYYVKCENHEEKQMIIEECEQVKKDKIDKDGKQCIIPKDKVKELIGRSPDYTDMMIMREWFELKGEMIFG